MTSGSVIFDVNIRRFLSDKSYERRKQGGTELEENIKMLLANEALVDACPHIQKVIDSLRTEFLGSSLSNCRKGGLLGLASIAIALEARYADKFLDNLLVPVLYLFSDPEPRVRYYACETAYNIMKVAQTSSLKHFPKLLEGVCVLHADVEPETRHGAVYLDRLLKDIVLRGLAIRTNDVNFHIVDPETLIDTIRDRLNVVSTNMKQHILSWVKFVGSCPEVNIYQFTSKLIGHLLRCLEDSNSMIRQTAETAVSGAFSELAKRTPATKDLAFVVETTSLVVKETQRLTSSSAMLVAFQWIQHMLSIVKNTTLITQDLNSPSSYPNEKSDEFPTKSERRSSVSQSTSFSYRMQHLYSSMLASVFSALSDFPSSSEVALAAVEMHHILVPLILEALQHQRLDGMKDLFPIVLKGLVTTSHDNAEACDPATITPLLQDELNSINKTIVSSSSFSKDIVPVWLKNHRRSSKKISEQHLGDENTSREILQAMGLQWIAALVVLSDETVQGFDGEYLLKLAMKFHSHSNVSIARASLRAIMALSLKLPSSVNSRVTQLLVQSIAKDCYISDSSLQLSSASKQMICEVLALRDPCIMFKELSSTLLTMVERWRFTIKGTTTKINTIIIESNHNNIVLDDKTEESHKDANSISSEKAFLNPIEIADIVGLLNWLLLTSQETTNLRNDLREGSLSELLLHHLFPTWFYNPVATIALALWTRHYFIANEIVKECSNMEMSMKLLKQLDQLVQLIESPIFSPLRMELVQPQNTELRHTLLSIAALLPQTSAFAMLSRRLQHANMALSFHTHMEHNNNEYLLSKVERHPSNDCSWDNLKHYFKVAQEDQLIVPKTNVHANNDINSLRDSALEDLIQFKVDIPKPPSKHFSSEGISSTHTLQGLSGLNRNATADYSANRYSTFKPNLRTFAALAPETCCPTIKEGCINNSHLELSSTPKRSKSTDCI